MEFLIQWDESLFLLINDSLQNSFFDIVMPIVRNKYIWAPLYIFLITYICTSFSLQKASYYLLFIISAVAITDFTSGQIFKKYVQRERPCNDIRIAEQSTSRVYCSSSYSFPSSHATNHFGMAIIFITLFSNYKKWLQPLLFTWAGLISFAQIYVGVHYPLDVIGGIILGVLLVKVYLIMVGPILDRLRHDTYLQSNIEK